MPTGVRGEVRTDSIQGVSAFWNIFVRSEGNGVVSVRACAPSIMHEQRREHGEGYRSIRNSERSWERFSASSRPLPAAYTYISARLASYFTTRFFSSQTSEAVPVGKSGRSSRCQEDTKLPNTHRENVLKCKRRSAEKDFCLLRDAFLSNDSFNLPPYCETGTLSGCNCSS